MVLSDLGAEVVRVDRKGDTEAYRAACFQLDSRGRRSIALDLKQREAVETCLMLFEKADIVFEGYRPGVMERLGLGPDVALTRNQRLVYGRMTGWGQTGSYAHAAGHDINYIAISGILNAIGPESHPLPPLNLVGDYGGALLLTTGLLSAYLHARETGEGQVVDAAISDAGSYLATLFYGMHAAGQWIDRRASNLLDGGAPFYGAFRCADDRWVAIGAIEPKFFALLLEKLGLPQIADRQMDHQHWRETRVLLEETFAKKTQEEWCALLEGTDACFSPVMSFAEAPTHQHNRSRGVFVEIDGVSQPAPTPRFSRTPGSIQGPPPEIGAHTRAILTQWGVTDGQIDALLASGAI
jgi:alpha-methylacyl-CoA racemase